MSDSAPSAAPELIEEDRPCESCGYNLRGLPLSGRCPECGETISCHNGICYSCGLEKLKNKKKIHTWEDQ